MNLRNHDQPCGHEPVDLGELGIDGAFNLDGYWECMKDECPGGAAVVIDYEAARVELADDYQRIRDHIGGELAEIAKWIVDAALDLEDDD